MGPYLAVLSARIRMLLQYRAAALAGMSTQLFWGLIRVMIFEAFYRTSTQAQPMTFAEVVNYVWLGQALFALLPWSPDNDIRAMVRNGTVAYELVRPIDLYTFWYSRSLANRIAPTLLRSVPLFCLAFLFFDLQAPASPAAAGAWALATVGALLMGGALSNLVNISMLWTIAGEGTIQMMAVCTYIFSGMVVPLPLFPDWAQPILNFMPFRGLVDTPFRLYMGHIPASQVLAVVGHQLLWTLALVGLGRFLLHRGSRRLVVQGG
ncbi:MAG: ABC-2 type transporter [Candidatus Latescibacteria bacterium]|nr:ABC-2 type transporter [Candidatus Latescibacterota bacterium]